VQLYNLKEDLVQKHNLAKQFPERVKQMQSKLEEIRKQEMFIEGAKDMAFNIFENK